jgi:S-DNA-T family DNA segregation ATPase FtsK/SpoIIIE
MIERMEQQGLVGRPDHVGRREVLIDTEGHAI